MMKKFLAGLVSVLVIGGLSAAPTFAFPQFWSDNTKTTLLRSVTSSPKDQPDALEFNNKEPVVSVVHFIQTAREKKEKKELPPVTVVCSEMEFGTTVLVNNGEAETKLALPFGVDEGDECFGPGESYVPTYFDTNAAGAVPATITFTGVNPNIIAHIHKLKFSSDVAGTFCTTTFEGIEGKVENVTSGFMEEMPPNLNLQFTNAIGTGTCVEKETRKIKVELTANFFLETMSTITDTAFIE